MSDRPIILHVFPSFDPGGMELLTAGFMNWSGDRYAHRVISIDGKAGARDKLDENIILQQGPRHEGDGFWQRQRAIAAVLKSINPSVLMTYNWGAIEWAFCRRLRSSKIRHVHVEGGFGIEEAHRVIPRRALFRRLALGATSAVVVVSHTLRDIACKVWRQPESRVHYIAGGVDTERFSPEPTLPSDTEAREPALSEVIIGTVSSFRPEKCLKRLVEAFAILRRDHQVRLLLVGDGMEMDSLLDIVKVKGLRDFVTFAGFRDDPESYYRQMDVFAMSSETEQLPNVILQAMASGLPVASTDVGDIGLVVCEENRPFVSGVGSDSLAKSLAKLIEDGDLRRKIGESNRSRAVANHSLDAMNRAYADIIDAALS